MFNCAAPTTLSSILALNTTLSEPLKATAEAVMSPDTEKFLLVARIVDVLANATSIFALPLNEVPPIVLAVANTVAVPAFPEALPVTSPVISPTKAVEVIEVAPVTTPASIMIAPSNTICCPPRGVMFKSVPAVLEIVLPLIFILSTCRAVSVPPEVIAV